MNQSSFEPDGKAEPVVYQTVEGSEDASPFGLDLRRAWLAVRRNWKWIGMIVVAALTASIAISMLMIPMYVGTSRILVEQQVDQIISDSTKNNNNSFNDADRFLQTQVDIIGSRALALRVVQAKNFGEDQRFFEAMGAKMPTKDSVAGVGNPAAALAEARKRAAASVLQQSLTVNLPAESRILAVNVKSASASLSADIANSVAEAYIQSNLERQFQSSAYARQFLSEELEQARQKLEESERDLNRYSRAAGLIRVSGQGQNADQETTLSVTNDSLVQVNNAASQATAERIAAQDRWQKIEKQSPLSVTEVLQNSAIQRLLEQRATAQSKLADERERHLDGYPTIKALQAELSEINRQIDTLGNSIKKSIYLDYQAAQEKEQSLTGQVNDIRANAMDEQDRGVQYSLLKRVKDTNRALYDTLLVRYNELSATAGAALNNVSLVDRAEPPAFPTSPKLVLNMLLGLFAGIGFAAIFVVLRELLDDAVRGPADVEEKLGLPLLGVIPRAEDQDISLELEDSKSSVSEAYSSLVANLNLSSAGGVPPVLVVTSSQESEGKSTTAYAIARNLARLDKRVLLVDVDLRRPTLHGKTQTRSQPGVTAVLTGNADLQEVLVSSEQPNLSYLTALPMPPDPSLLLGSERFKHLVRSLSEIYDVIVLDAPPVLGLSDTPNIAAHSAAVVFVVDASHNHRGGIKTALRRLGLVRANIAGVVLTKFDPKNGAGNYGYYAYNYYQYGTK